MHSCFYSGGENAFDNNVSSTHFADKSTSSSRNDKPEKMSMQQFCLRWNNHQPNFISVFSNLLHSETLTDVTLAAEGRHLQAHKVVLSACSSYFQSLFTVNPCQHPIVILKDVKFSDLKIMVDFMYYGEVNVSQDQLPSIIKTAENLKIKGLAEMHTASFSKWPSEARGERAESCSPSSSPQSPSYRRKRMRKSSAGSNSGDKSEEVNEITLVATNTVKPEPLLISQDAIAENAKRPAKPSTESQESIDEDQISIMSNMESSSNAAPVQSEASIQDLNQQPGSNMSQSSIASQPPHQEIAFDQGFFNFMTDDMIKELIPEIDLRLKFKRKYEDYKAKVSQQTKATMAIQATQTMEMQSTSTQSMDEFIVDLDDSLFIDVKDVAKVPQETEATVVQTSTDKNNEVINFVDFPDKTNFQSCSNFQIEEVSHLQMQREGMPTLRQLLMGDSTGREILKMYEKIKKVDRSKLATVIIRSETERDPDTRIRADRFNYWAQEIVTLFPNEVRETYYIPYSRGPDGPLSARGILWSKYTNRRRSLRGKGILEPKRLKNKKNPLECPQETFDDEIEIENVEWLKKNVGPRDEVTEKWISSCRSRLSKIESMTVEEYFDTYKCLQQSFGHCLLDIDFQFLHGDVSNKLQSAWPSIAAKLVAYGLKQTSVEVKNFLTMYNNEIEEETRARTAQATTLENVEVAVTKEIHPSTSGNAVNNFADASSIVNAPHASTDIDFYNFAPEGQSTPIDQDNNESSKSCTEPLYIKSEIEEESFDIDAGEENKCTLESLSRDMTIVKNDLARALDMLDALLQRSQFQMTNSTAGPTAMLECFEHIESLFPLYTEEQLHGLEEMLKNTNIKDDIKKYLIGLGGTTVALATTEMLRATVADDLASQYSWSGLKGKRSLEELEFIKLICTTVQQRIDGATRLDVRARIMAWFKQAESRRQGKKSKIKRMQSAYSSPNLNRQGGDKSYSVGGSNTTQF